MKRDRQKLTALLPCVRELLEPWQSLLIDATGAAAYCVLLIGCGADRAYNGARGAFLRALRYCYKVAKYDRSTGTVWK